MHDKDLILFLEAHTHYSIKHFVGYSRLDSYFLNERGELVGFLERKTRNVPIAQYDTAIIDFQKYQAMKDIEEATSLNAWLAYGWSDGVVGVVQPTRCPIQVEMATPSDDSVSFNKGVQREVAHIEIKRFEILGTIA